MKVVEDAWLGISAGTFIQFTKREQATLLAASAIAEKAREMARSRFGPDFENHPHDVLLAEVEHGCREIVNGLEISD